MRERVRPVARVLLSSVIVLATSAALAAPAHAQVSGTCVVKITRFMWEPSKVHPGDRTKLVLVARNCTDRTIDVAVTEYGKRIPPCPLLDPIGSSATLKPRARYAPRPLHMIAPQCNGVEDMVVTLSDPHGTVLARATATVRIVPKVFVRTILAR